jgi:hypothetical protein
MSARVRLKLTADRNSCYYRFFKAAYILCHFNRIRRIIMFSALSKASSIERFRDGKIRVKITNELLAAHRCHHLSVH